MAGNQVNEYLAMLEQAYKAAHPMPYGLPESARPEQVLVPRVPITNPYRPPSRTNTNRVTSPIPGRTNNRVTSNVTRPPKNKGRTVTKLGNKSNSSHVLKMDDNGPGVGGASLADMFGGRFGLGGSQSQGGLPSLSSFDPSGLLGQINDILARQQPTPDRWVSPYSQADLDLMGQRFQTTGDETSREYLQAMQEINANAARSQQMRQQNNTAFTDELAANARNIGVDYAQGAEAKQLAADAGYLDEVGRQNTESSAGFNQKMADSTLAQAKVLADMTRQGMMTPKQFVPGSNEMNPADQLAVQVLMSQIDRGYQSTDQKNALLSAMYGEQMDARTERANSDLEYQRELAKMGVANNYDKDQILFRKEVEDATGLSDEEYRSTEFESALRNLSRTNPELHSLVENYYFRSGRDLDKLGSLVAEDAIGAWEPPPELTGRSLMESVIGSAASGTKDPYIEDWKKAATNRAKQQEAMNFLEKFLYGSRTG